MQRKIVKDFKMNPETTRVLSSGPIQIIFTFFFSFFGLWAILKLFLFVENE